MGHLYEKWQGEITTLATVKTPLSLASQSMLGGGELGNDLKRDMDLDLGPCTP